MSQKLLVPVVLIDAGENPLEPLLNHRRLEVALGVRDLNLGRRASVRIGVADARRRNALDHNLAPPARRGCLPLNSVRLFPSADRPDGGAHLAARTGRPGRFLLPCSSPRRPRGQHDLAALRDECTGKRIPLAPRFPPKPVNSIFSASATTNRHFACPRRARNSSSDPGLSKSFSYSACGMGKATIRLNPRSSAARATSRSAPSANAERTISGVCGHWSRNSSIARRIVCSSTGRSAVRKSRWPVAPITKGK